MIIAIIIHVSQASQRSTVKHRRCVVPTTTVRSRWPIVNPQPSQQAAERTLLRLAVARAASLCLRLSRLRAVRVLFRGYVRNYAVLPLNNVNLLVELD